MNERAEIRVACLTVASKVTHLGPDQVVLFARAYEAYVLDEESHKATPTKEGTLGLPKR